MPTPDVEALLAVLADLGARVVVLQDGQVLAVSEGAKELPDPVALAERATTEPVLVTLAERQWEARASRTGNMTVLLLRDVEEREEARRSQARSDELLSLGSHELKGPLHVIGMICHLLENRSLRGEPLDRGTLDRLRRQVARLNRLINQLLDLSRAQEKRLVLDLDDIDFADLVRDQIASVEGARAADLTADVAASAPLRGDRVRLGEAAHQLIDNAVRFTDAGTALVVTLRDDHDAWLLTVADHGAGISPEDQALLFHRYVRRDRGRGPQGLGLGLYISSIVAQLHGGTLTFEPTSPSGATFNLRIPHR